MPDQPSKESLQRAIKFKVHSDCYWDNACSRCIRLALEFDAIAEQGRLLGREQIMEIVDLQGFGGRGTVTAMNNLRQQNAALVSALRELEQKWRMEAQSIREQTEKGKTSGCIMMATVIEWEEEADRFDAHADELKKILAPYAPAEGKEKA